jgi:hypothetical protein
MYSAVILQFFKKLLIQFSRPNAQMPNNVFTEGNYPIKLFTIGIQLFFSNFTSKQPKNARDIKKQTYLYA